MFVGIPISEMLQQGASGLSWLDRGLLLLVMLLAVLLVLKRR